MSSAYKVLGVDPRADDERIESAYRERVKEVHPDMGGSPEEFMQVKAAYEEIKSESSESTTGTQQRQSSNPRVELAECTICGSSLYSRSEMVYGNEPHSIYCTDCVVDTECIECGTPLRITVEQYEAVDKQPLCTSCGEGATTDTQESAKFVDCYLCGEAIHDPNNAVKRPSNGKFYCEGCIIETNCARCGNPLTLTIDRFADLNGNPVCKNCAANNSSSKSFIQKSIDAVAIFGVVAIAAWLVFGVYDASISQYISQFVGDIDPAVSRVVPTVVLVLLLYYWQSD